MRVRTVPGLVLVCFGAATLASADAQAKKHRHQKHDRASEGRRHLQKANALAGENDCEAAVPEYTAAYEKLHDPVVLFNRAECLRRLGQDDKAAADYRAFLLDVPEAPNRVEIEERLAALEAPRPPPAPATPPPKPRVTIEKPPEAPVEATAAPVPLVEAHPKPSLEEKPKPHRSHWWVWVALGTAVAAGGTVGFLLLRPQGQTIPSTALGDYHF